MFTEHGTLVSWDISPLNESERTAAQRVFDRYAEDVLPSRGQKTISVCTTDVGFTSPRVRRRLQELRIVPNMHEASTADRESSIEQAERRDAEKIPFKHPSKPHYANWFVTGHAAIDCNCGKGSIERIFEVGKSGKLTIAARGNCKTCGSVQITAGKWRASKERKRIVLAFDERNEPEIGNSLTFRDPIAREYGKDRFGWNESVHATLHRRFGLLRESWNRSKTEVEIEFAIVASAISVLILERAKARGIEEHAPEEQAA
jgi:hypothetical protein